MVMMKKVERNELRLCWILADLQKRVLCIPKGVKENSKILSRGEASLYFEYKNRYADCAESLSFQ